jgi:hypothetical protein
MKPEQSLRDFSEMRVDPVIAGCAFGYSGIPAHLAETVEESSDAGNP